MAGSRAEECVLTTTGEDRQTERLDSSLSGKREVAGINMQLYSQDLRGLGRRSMNLELAWAAQGLEGEWGRGHCLPSSSQALPLQSQ